MITTLAEKVKVVIKNLLSADEKYYSNVGKRTVMPLADVKAMRICDFEFLLNAQGNFMKAVKDENGVVTVEDYAEGETINGDGKTYDDMVAVVTRTNTRINDRFIQFFATQQKILLAPGDTFEFNVKTAAEVAHYKALAVDGEIEVVIEGLEEEE
jgi:hypothetical protein